MLSKALKYMYLKFKNSISLCARCIGAVLFILYTSGAHAQFEKRNTRVEIVSNSTIGILAWGSLTGGASLSLQQKINQRIELGAHAGYSIGERNPKLSILFRPEKGDNYLIGRQIMREYGVNSSFYFTRKGAFAPIGAHIYLGLNIGYAVEKYIFRTPDGEPFESESGMIFNDGSERTIEEFNYIRPIIGIGNTVQFNTHLTFRTMIALAPRINFDVERSNNNDFPTTLIGPDTFQSALYLGQIAFGYQF